MGPLCWQVMSASGEADRQGHDKDVGVHMASAGPDEGVAVLVRTRRWEGACFCCKPAKPSTCSLRRNSTRASPAPTL